MRAVNALWARRYSVMHTVGTSMERRRNAVWTIVCVLLLTLDRRNIQTCFLCFNLSILC